MSDSEFVAIGTADPTNGTIKTLDLMFDPNKNGILGQKKVQELKTAITAYGVGKTNSGQVVINSAESSAISAILAPTATPITDITIGGSRKRSSKKKTQKRGGKRQKGGKSRRV